MTISNAPVNRTVAATPAAGTTLAITIPAPTAGNTLIVRADTVGATGSTKISDISLSGVSAFATRVQAIAGRSAEIWDAIKIGAGVGTTVNVTFASAPSSTNGAVIVEEWSGIGSFGVGNSATGTSTTPTTATLTPSVGIDALFVAIFRCGAVPVAGSLASPWLPSGGNTSDVRDMDGYLRVASTVGTYSTSMTQASGNWDAAIAVYYGPGLTMAVDLPTAAPSGLTPYNNTASGNVTISGGIGTASLSVTNAGKMRAGAWIKILAGASPTYQFSSFDGTTGGVLVQQSGAAAPNTASTAFIGGSCIAVQISSLAAGVPITATIKTGTGALQGTTTVNTDSFGNAIFDALNIVGSGAHVLTFSSPGFGSVDSASMTVQAAYSVKGDFIAVFCVKEPILGLALPCKFLVPTAAAVGVAGPLVYSGGGASTSGTDCGPPGLGGSFMYWGMGNDVNANKATVTDFYLFVQMPPGNSEATTKVPWRGAVPTVLNAIIAAGFNLNLRRIDLYGYSMTAINVTDLAFMYPRLWRTVSDADGTFTLGHLTNAGSGVMEAFHPATIQAAVDLWIGRVQNNMGIYLNCGDPNAPASDTGFAGVDSLFAQMAVDGYASTVYDQLTQTVPTTDRRVRVNWQEATHTTYSHGGMDSPPSLLSNSNWQNWRVAQPDGLGLFTIATSAGGYAPIGLSLALGM